MTYATNAAGEKLLFKFGDGGAPETFTSSCSINTDRKLELSSDIFTGTVPKCDDPSAPNKTVRRVKAIDVKFTGAGTSDMASALALMQLWKSGQPFNGKAIQDVESHGWTIDAQWVIENMSMGGTKGDDQTFDISLAIADGFDLTVD